MFRYFHLVVWSQFAFGSLSPPLRNQSFVVDMFRYFHLVVWSQFAFGSLPLPPPHPKYMMQEVAEEAAINAQLAEQEHVLLVKITDAE